MSLHNVYVVCQKCGDDMILLKDRNIILCWQCADDYNNKLHPICPFCCHDLKHDINCCHWCGDNTNLTKVNHWFYDELKTFSICEECIITDIGDGKNIRKALHPFLSIIK